MCSNAPAHCAHYHRPEGLSRSTLHKGQITLLLTRIPWNARLGVHSSQQPKSVTLSWTHDNSCDTPAICYSCALQSLVNVDFSAVVAHQVAHRVRLRLP
jgi:hypothetical protein